MIKNAEGNIYGYIEVLEMTNKRKNGYVVYKCKCNKCGRIFENSLEHYRARAKQGIDTMTCGCYDRHHNNLYKSGLSNTRLRYIYDNMKSRCNNKNNKNYKNYGGRGITICNEWLNEENGFETFYKWAINNGYAKKLTIDRINNDGNYEPNNCRWTNFREQIINRRNMKKFNYNGIIKTLPEFAKQYNIALPTLKDRIRRGWNIERALNEKVHKNFKGKHNKKYYEYVNTERNTDE